MLPQVLSMKKELNPVELDFLLRFPFKAGVLSPVDFLQHQGWGGIKVGVGTLSRSGGSLLTPGMFTTRYHRPDVQGPGEAPEVGLEGRGSRQLAGNSTFLYSNTAVTPTGTRPTS